MHRGPAGCDPLIANTLLAISEEVCYPVNKAWINTHIDQLGDGYIVIDTVKGLAEISQNKGRCRFTTLSMLIQRMHQVDGAVCSGKALTIAKLLWINVGF